MISSISQRLTSPSRYDWHHLTGLLLLIWASPLLLTLRLLNILHHLIHSLPLIHHALRLIIILSHHF